MRGIDCRLNFENRPVRSRDIKGGRKQPPATNRGSQEPAINRVNPKISFEGNGPETSRESILDTHVSSYSAWQFITLHNTPAHYTHLQRSSLHTLSFVKIRAQWKKNYLRMRILTSQGRGKVKNRRYSTNTEQLSKSTHNRRFLYHTGWWCKPTQNWIDFTVSNAECKWI